MLKNVRYYWVPAGNYLCWTLWVHRCADSSVTLLHQGWRNSFLPWTKDRNSTHLKSSVVDIPCFQQIGGTTLDCLIFGRSLIMRDWSMIRERSYADSGASTRMMTQFLYSIIVEKPLFSNHFTLGGWQSTSFNLRHMHDFVRPWFPRSGDHPPSQVWAVHSQIAVLRSHKMTQ